MQEFTSISVSSYDAAALTGRLTEASAEGWDVVAIVPAGTSVVAYLARESHGAPSTAASVSDDTGGDDFGFRLGSSGVPEAAAAETALSDDAAVEPAGWASEPAPAAPTPTPEPRPEVEPAPAAPVPTPEPDPTPEPTSATEPDRAPAHTETHAAAEQSQAAQAAAAPAGWYADPAGRYELRYWDGSQWTEHVSRAGQQYTDPPVA